MLLKIEIFGFRLPEPQLNDLLLFIALLQILIMVFIYARHYPAFREFIYLTFTDVTKRPDAKLVSAFWFSAITTFLILRGSFFKDSWPPESLVDSLLTFISVLLGVDAFVSGAKFLSKVKKPTPPEDPAQGDEQTPI